MVGGGKWGLTGVCHGDGHGGAAAFCSSAATWSTQAQLKRAAAATCPHLKLPAIKPQVRIGGWSTLTIAFPPGISQMNALYAVCVAWGK